MIIDVLLQVTPTPPPLPSDTVIAFVLFDIAVILLAARIMGSLAQRIGQPRVVG